MRRHRDELEEERRAAVALDHSIKAQHRLKESAGRDVEAAEIRLTNQRERVRTEQEARVAQAAENHQQAVRRNCHSPQTHSRLTPTHPPPHLPGRDP